jgi:3D (Asp-Asp-Asp) domain-containing protein
LYPVSGGMAGSRPGEKPKTSREGSHEGSRKDGREGSRKNWYKHAAVASTAAAALIASVVSGSPMPTDTMANGQEATGQMAVYEITAEPFYLYPTAMETPSPLVPSDVSPAMGNVESIDKGRPSRDMVSDRSGNRRTMAVRLTYYVDRGPMRTGHWTFDGAAASDTRVIPHGTFFRIVGDDKIRVALDTGSLVIGNHVDIWVASDEEGKGLIARFGDHTEIEIVQQ